MVQIFQDPCCDRKGSGCDKIKATDKFCCKFNVASIDEDNPTILFETAGCAFVTACFKIENVSDTDEITIFVNGNETTTVLPCSCTTGVIQGCGLVIAAITDNSSGADPVATPGKIDIKLFYDIHDS
ncbi:S-Ena type endospore appendage [Cytobacillus sp. IB215665]|uniref:S-Ena type endospore appendage n=1 Tax=Cytobacillus sp. IB215665 TaxID=3097357 RepID=UPI002A14D817|nr:S-Ena type endospore appendage [Cytobacillus sp. IB215665]MDX8366943.1 S-Ena type endospore appendage [Cytobacillus sp. IB215665]